MKLVIQKTDGTERHIKLKGQAVACPTDDETMDLVLQDGTDDYGAPVSLWWHCNRCGMTQSFVNGV